MSIPYVVDGETDLDSLLFNPIIDAINQQNQNVKAWGAVGDGITNDRAAIQRAIDAAVDAGGGRVFFPAGTYRVQITETGIDRHCLTIDGDYVTLAGETGSVIDCFPYGGDPDTHWQVVTGAVWRGGGVFVTGGSDYANRRRNVCIDGLEIDGNFTFTGNVTTPANTGTGDGWDITHKGVWFENDTYHDQHTVTNCHIHNFSGEHIYAGGGDTGATPVLGAFLVQDNTLHDCNGSIVSVSGQWVRVLHNEIDTCASGIENATQSGWHEYAYNRIRAAVLDAVILVSFGEGTGGGDIHHNRIESSDKYGIGLISAWNTKCHHNTIIDCEDGGIRQEVASGYPNDWSQDTAVYDNLILADQVTMGVGISVAFDTAQVRRNRVMRNTITRTQYAVDHSKIVNEPYSDYPTTEHNNIEVRENQYYGTHGDSTASAAYNSLLTTTGQTTVASRKLPTEGMLLVSVAYRVITAATDVTVTITSVDQDGNATTYAVQALTNKATGSYVLPSYLVPTGQRATCAVKVTAGTANQVYVSSTIREA